jgi:hypothetical protein
MSTFLTFLPFFHGFEPHRTPRRFWRLVKVGVLILPQTPWFQIAISQWVFTKLGFEKRRFLTPGRFSDPFWVGFLTLNRLLSAKLVNGFWSDLGTFWGGFLTLWEVSIHCYDPLREVSFDRFWGHFWPFLDPQKWGFLIGVQDGHF